MMYLLQLQNGQSVYFIDLEFMAHLSCL